MLVENPLKMESRCSTGWTIASACMAAPALTAFARLLVDIPRRAATTALSRTTRQLNS